MRGDDADKAGGEPGLGVKGRPQPQGKSAPFVTLEPEPQHVGNAKAIRVVPEDPGRSLDEFKYERLEAEIADLRQQQQERIDLHAIRRRHAWLLFMLTICWIVVIWLVVLLQGFGRWFGPMWEMGSKYMYLHFKLSDSILIAFMTSTTATVLGLYGIAAYWLYGSNKKTAEPIDRKKVPAVYDR